MLGCLKFMAASAEVSAAAESSAAEAAKKGGGLGSFMPLIMLVVFAAIFYFLLIRPEKKRKKAEQKQRDSMRVGDTVITIGGITGEIESIREETITLFTGSNSVDVQKWAIRSVIPDTDSDSAESAEKDENSAENEAKEN